MTTPTSTELQQSDTAKLAAGEYVVLIQHPMENGVFDVVYDPSSGTVTNVQTGKQIFQLTGSGSLQSTGAVTALMNAIGSQNIDDTFAVVTFYVSQPATSINPIGDLQAGKNSPSTEPPTLLPATTSWSILRPPRLTRPARRRPPDFPVPAG